MVLVEGSGGGSGGGGSGSGGSGGGPELEENVCETDIVNTRKRMLFSMVLKKDRKCLLSRLLTTLVNVGIGVKILAQQDAQL